MPQLRPPDSNTLPGLRMPFGSNARLRRRIVSISAALRRLIDEARRADGGRTAQRQAQEAAYRVMTTLGGDLPGYEEATRALFAGDLSALADRLSAWPDAVRAYVCALAMPKDDT